MLDAALEHQRLALWALTRSGIEQGEWWRLWSGHLVHTDPSHLLPNLLALATLTWVSMRMGLLLRAATLLVLLAPALSLALLLGLPGLYWYAGLSGLLHGWLALLVLTLPLRLRVLALMALGAKLLEEALRMPEGAAESFAVLTEAHVLGTLLGLMLSIMLTAISLTQPGLRKAVKPVNSQGRNASSRPTP